MLNGSPGTPDAGVGAGGGSLTTGLAIGTTTITATYMDRAASVTLTVQAPGTADGGVNSGGGG